MVQNNPAEFTAAATDFVDRRQAESHPAPPAYERRQFGNSYDSLTPDARELALAIDGYKLRNHRRFVTYEEMLFVVKSLGYAKVTEEVTA
jgi:hypothetical protein